MANDPEPATVAATVAATHDLTALTARLADARPFNIGFPGATDFDYTALGELLCRHLLNNVGDPWVDGVAANHTKQMEREVVEFVADLLRAPQDDRWGYVTSGGSESNLYGLWLGRAIHPDAVVYLSEQAHASLSKAVDLLGLPSVTIRARVLGAIDDNDLADQLSRHRHRPAIIAATAGTTLSEAVDDLRIITAVLEALTIRRRFIHVDAALSGIPLALLEPDRRPGFDFADGADCVAVSGHKFLGAPFPCGVVVTRAGHRARVAHPVGYAGSPDATIAGSRSGHAPLLLWYAIRRHGIDGLRRRAEAARELATYAHARLTEIGWEAHRHQHAFTVLLRTPPQRVTAKWVLASTRGWSHIITMPGVSRETVDRFVADLDAAIAASLARGDADAAPITERVS